LNPGAACADLGRRELRGLDAAFNHPALALDQLEFAEPQKVRKRPANPTLKGL
jgi:hypothetical protein